MESEQVIREKMEKTRESLTEKLETLENKLIGSVEDATTAVRETVTSVKDTMHESVETVKDAFDVKGHIERHPWLMFGGALVGGFALTKLLIPDKRSSSRGFTLTPMLSDTRDYQEPRRSSSTTMTESLMGMLKPELQRLKGLAVGMTLGVVRDFVSKQAPPHLANQLRSIIDGVTKKIGGEPTPRAICPLLIRRRVQPTRSRTIRGTPVAIRENHLNEPNTPRRSESWLTQLSIRNKNARARSIRTKPNKWATRL